MKFFILSSRKIKRDKLNGGMSVSPTNSNLTYLKSTLTHDAEWVSTISTLKRLSESILSDTNNYFVLYHNNEYLNQKTLSFQFHSIQYVPDIGNFIFTQHYADDTAGIKSRIVVPEVCIIALQVIPVEDDDPLVYW